MLVTDLIPAKERDSRCLMIVMHGLGDSMEGYRWLPSALNLPWLNYILVNAPDRYYMGYSWYEFAGDPLPGVKRSRESISKLLDDLHSKNFLPEQTMLFGFSQGCLMTIETGLRYPQKLAGLIGISGYVQEPEKLLKELSPVAKQQRLLVTHGTYDPLIPFQKVKQQMQMLKDAGIQLDWREFAKDHTIAGEEELNVIRDFVKAGFGKH